MNTRFLLTALLPEEQPLLALRQDNQRAPLQELLPDDLQDIVKEYLEPENLQVLLDAKEQKYTFYIEKRGNFRSEEYVSDWYYTAYVWDFWQEQSDKMHCCYNAGCIGSLLLLVPVAIVLATSLIGAILGAFIDIIRHHTIPTVTWEAEIWNVTGSKNKELEGCLTDTPINFLDLRPNR